LGAGMDCANHEVNGMRVQDFKVIRKTQGTGDDIQGDAPTKGDSTGSLYTSVQSHFSAITHENVSKMKGIFKQMRAESPNAKLAGLFEPLMVEYLSLDVVISSSSVWDRIPANWERFRLMGYANTRAKAESLWAFVNAHEKVLHESACMTRFPDLVRCINTLVTLAKNDLSILAEVQPRRIFYAKHTLALRVLMNRRLAKLENFTKQGWISPADGEGLVDALWERILQADQYNPRVAHRQKSSSSPSGSDKKWSITGSISDSIGPLVSNSSLDSECNAWADLDLPVVPSPCAVKQLLPGREDAGLAPQSPASGSSDQPKVFRNQSNLRKEPRGSIEATMTAIESTSVSAQKSAESMESASAVTVETASSPSCVASKGIPSAPDSLPGAVQ